MFLCCSNGYFGCDTVCREFLPLLVNENARQFNLIFYPVQWETHSSASFVLSFHLQSCPISIQYSSHTDNVEGFPAFAVYFCDILEFLPGKWHYQTDSSAAKCSLHVYLLKAGFAIPIRIVIVASTGSL